jgi:hypothetical protein
MIAPEILVLLARFDLTLTIKPDGSWSMHNPANDEHFSGKLISELTEYVEFVICDKRRESKVPERGDLSAVTT